MPSSSNHQNNNIASQTVTLPRSYLNYLCSQENDCFNSDGQHNFRLFPGIEIKEQDEESIKVSINHQALPGYYQAPQTQEVIQQALQTLKSISALPADVINPEARKGMALSIHKALKSCLLLENSKSSTTSNSKVIAFLSFRIAITLAMIAAYLILLAPLAIPAFVIPAALAMAMSIFVASSLAGIVAAATIRDIAKLINSASISKQAKIDCDKLDNAIKAAKSGMSPTTSDSQEPPQASSSAAAAAVNEPATSSKRSESPTRSSSTFYQPAAAANSPVEPSDVEQENTATTASHP